MGQRVGPVSCLAFHPLRVSVNAQLMIADSIVSPLIHLQPLLAVGTNDSFISIYSARSQGN